MSSIAEILLAKWQGNTVGLRDDYKSKLEHGVWIVEFKKVDGTDTTMECTLDPKLLPIQESQKPARVVNDDVVAVYSLDRQGWRSFRVDRVKACYPKPENY